MIKHLIFIKSLSLLFLLQCSPEEDRNEEDPTKNGSSNENTEEPDLSIMTLNIIREGTKISNSVEKVGRVIKEVDPDVVCFSEDGSSASSGWFLELSNNLAQEGLSYHSDHPYGADVSLLSKFPIREKENIYGANYYTFRWGYRGSIAKFKLDLGLTNLTVGCAHLDWDYYTPYLPRGYGDRLGWSYEIYRRDIETNAEKVLRQNDYSYRTEQIKAFTQAVEETGPVILLGDFNEPSHLDWVESTKHQFGHNGAVIPWPVTTHLEDIGYIDAYREYFPNPLVNPGVTWPSTASGHTDGKFKISWADQADERERIDFIFHKGKDIETTYATLIGPKNYYISNKITPSPHPKENFLADKLEWPSDHKGVLVRLKIPGLIPSGLRED